MKQSFCSVNGLDNVNIRNNPNGLVKSVYALTFS